MSRYDFVDDRRYATDCGPQCESCKSEMWIYLIDDLALKVPYSPEGMRVDAQCACCHRLEMFRLDDRCESPPTIGDVKRAHFATRIKASL